MGRLRRACVTLVVGVLALATVAFLTTGGESPPERSQDRLDRIEADRGFALRYPGARLVESDRQPFCEGDESNNPSGGPPELWRDFRTSAPTEAVLAFYDSRLTPLGWTPIPQESEASPGADLNYERRFGTWVAQLGVAAYDVNRVEIAGQAFCAQN